MRAPCYWRFGGAAAWLDAVLAEQVAQALELAVRSLVFAVMA
jgi:hypothetical protein